MKENGLKINNMVMEWKNGQMVLCIEDRMIWELSKDKVHLLGLMAYAMKENSKIM